MLKGVSMVIHVTHRTLKAWRAYDASNHLLAPLQGSQLLGKTKSVPARCRRGSAVF